MTDDREQPPVKAAAPVPPARKDCTEATNPQLVVDVEAGSPAIAVVPANSQPRIEGSARVPVDGYQRGTFARWCGHRDRVNAWRDRPRAVPT